MQGGRQVVMGSLVEKGKETVREDDLVKFYWVFCEVGCWERGKRKEMESVTGSL